MKSLCKTERFHFRLRLYNSSLVDGCKYRGLYIKHYISLIQLSSFVSIDFNALSTKFKEKNSSMKGLEYASEKISIKL